MQYLLTGLERHGIGTRANTEEDFWRIVESEKIQVIYSEEKFPFSFTMLGEKFIVLPRRRKGLKLLFSMFHELAHLLLMNGRPVSVAFQGLEHCDNDKEEAEADAIALVALIPKHLIREIAGMDDSRYGNRLWRERCRLFFIYGI